VSIKPYSKGRNQQKEHSEPVGDRHAAGVIFESQQKAQTLSRSGC